MPTNRALRPATAALGLAALLTGCGGADSGGAAGGTQVVASTTQVADLARNVAGDRAAVTGLLAANSDPHGYEPRPSDAQAVAEADLVLRSGGDLDIWAGDLVDSAGADVEVVSMLEAIATVEGGNEADLEAEHAEHGHEDGDPAGTEPEHPEDDAAHEHEGGDPHWWQDPANAIATVATIRDELIAADPEGEAAYRRNAAAYSQRLERLDRAIAACMSRIPDEQRKLVTTHDAFGRFAEAYDIEVIGAAIPALTTQAQASAGDTQALVEQIESEGVQAIFPEEGLTPQLEEAIADEAGAVVGEGLWADALGPEGSTGATYIEAMAHNAEAMARGFSGGESGCRVEV